MNDSTCNTCGGTGKWETTLEDSPTTLTSLGPCPDCDARPFVEPSAALLYRVNDALTAICDEAHVTLPDDVLDNLTHTIANEIQRGDRDEAR